MENAHMENDRIENAHQGKRPKIQTLENGKKMHTQKLPELSLNSHTGKWQKIDTWKMAERKMHNTENERKFRYWKMAENTHLENDRTENARHRISYILSSTSF